MKNYKQNTKILLGLLNTRKVANNSLSYIYFQAYILFVLRLINPIDLSLIITHLAYVDSFYISSRKLSKSQQP